MRRAVYPGSFNPWHVGHNDVLKKASTLFDEIVVLNYDKDLNPLKPWGAASVPIKMGKCKIVYESFNYFLTKYVEDNDVEAVIRGLRNGHDLQYEMNQQYWYEDLGLDVPVVYFITDRKLGHFSSSAIRQIEGWEDK